MAYSYKDDLDRFNEKKNDSKKLTLNSLNLASDLGLDPTYGGDGGTGDALPQIEDADIGKALIVSSEKSAVWSDRGYSYSETEEVLIDETEVVTEFEFDPYGIFTPELSEPLPETITVVFDGVSYILELSDDGGYGAPFDYETGKLDFSEYPFNINFNSLSTEIPGVHTLSISANSETLVEEQTVVTDHDTSPTGEITWDFPDPYPEKLTVLFDGVYYNVTAELIALNEIRYGAPYNEETGKFDFSEYPFSFSNNNSLVATSEPGTHTIKLIKRDVEIDLSDEFKEAIGSDLPKATAEDAGKVLSVDDSGVYELSFPVFKAVYYRGPNDHGLPLSNDGFTGTFPDDIVNALVDDSLQYRISVLITADVAETAYYPRPLIFSGRKYGNHSIHYYTNALTVLELNVMTREYTIHYTPIN